MASEIAETISGLNDFREDYKRLVKGLTALAKKDFKSAAKEFGSPEGASSSWLSYQLGIKPLVDNIINARERILDALASGEFTVKTVTRRELPAPFLNDRYLRTGSAEGLIEWSTTFVIPESNVIALKRLGADNPFSVAWNLVPLSFVLNWVVDIGAFASGLTACNSLIFSHGYRTEVVRYDGIDIWDYAYMSSFGHPANTKCEGFAMRRVVSSGFPPPILALGSGLNEMRASILSALALTRSW